MLELVQSYCLLILSDVIRCGVFPHPFIDYITLALKLIVPQSSPLGSKVLPDTSFKINSTGFSLSPDITILSEYLDFFLPAIPNFWVDLWVIPADAKNIENAHLFLNYMMRPQVGANDSNYTWYATANKTAMEQKLIDEAVTSSTAAFPTAAQISTMYTLNPLPPKAERVRTRTWTNFKAGN